MQNKTTGENIPNATVSQYIKPEAKVMKMEPGQNDVIESLTTRPCTPIDFQDMIFAPDSDDYNTTLLEGYAPDMYCIDDPKPALLRG